MARWKLPDTVFSILAMMAAIFYPISTADLSPHSVESLRVVDRHGYLLREFLSDREGHGRWTTLDSLSPRLVQAAVIAEDKRFYEHRGVDILATMRALEQNIRAGQTVSGASTITQQVIRNLYHLPRNLASKAIEIWLAVRLEHTLSKQDILEQYLNRIPFGNLTFGAEAACQLYFGKAAFSLSWAEAAYLMALPKSPTTYNPYADRARATSRQHAILQRLREANRLTDDEWRRALTEKLILFPKTSPFFAPHFVEWATAHTSSRGEFRTTLDLPLQVEVEKIIKAEIRQHAAQDVTNAAVLVVDNETGGILAFAGSVDYFDESHDGQFNAVQAKRQPGSTLKPFTYALAFQKGYSPATIIADVETNIPSEKGTFTPKNYDNRFHGPVRVRQALACSYNVPAVRVVQDLGVAELLSLLSRVGFESLDQPPDYYGHGLTLGNGEVTLYELTRAYRTLANRGNYSDLTAVPRDTAISHRVLDERIVFLITSILSDPVARIPAFGYDSPISLPFPCASKTGTSSNYRDNWTLGYTQDYTVGVWVGNFDNAPMREVSGVSGAGPIFRSIMEYLYPDRFPAPFAVPAGVVQKSICSASGELPHNGCPSVMTEVFLKSQVPTQVCRVHNAQGYADWTAVSPVYRNWSQTSSLPTTRRNGTGQAKTVDILFPLHHSVFRIDPSVRRDIQALTFKALVSNDVAGVEWFLNNAPYAVTGPPYQTRWLLSPGTYRLRARTTDPPSLWSKEIEFEVIP